MPLSLKLGFLIAISWPLSIFVCFSSAHTEAQILCLLLMLSVGWIQSITLPSLSNTTNGNYSQEDDYTLNNTIFGDVMYDNGTWQNITDKIMAAMDDLENRTVPIEKLPEH
ncbi:hypothetical protein AHF37_08986 [Paragonimus kellicotti]|nr:hypothetical protein AHF37_08986 [Paragonimus kellicotti]